MSGVNHKKIRGLISEKKKTIKDRPFFTSRAFAGHLSDIATAKTKRYGYKRRVKVRVVWNAKDPNAARTNNELIWINAGFPMITKKKTRIERYNLIFGFFAHELGHLLYTDFLAGQSYTNYFQDERWFPEAPPLTTLDERMNADDMWHYCKSDEKKKNALISVAFGIGNILEDGYIESKMLNRYPGILGNNLDYMRQVHFKSMPTLTEMIEREDAGESHIWLTIQQLLLSYVKFGELKYGDEPLTDERVQVVFSLLTDLDKALLDSSAKERWSIVNIILVNCWKYIKDFLELCEQMSEDVSALGGGSGSTAGEIVSELVSKLVGSSKEASGNTRPVSETADSTNKPSAGGKRQETASYAAKSSGPDENDENSEDEAALAKPKNEPEGDGDAAELSAESKPEGDGGEPMTGIEKPFQDVSSEENGRLPLEQTDDLSEPVGGETEYDDDYNGSGYANSASDIERILDNIAENAVTTELESERTAELNELAKNISYGDIHSGIDVIVHRMPDVDNDMVEDYKSISGDLLRISKRLQQSIKDKIIDRRRGGKQTGLLFGRRLNSHALHRTDGHIFYNSSLPNEKPEIAIALLNDESGSMGSRDRATYARATSIILYDFCMALGIPTMVYGHSTGYGVDLYSYAEFDAIDRNDKYRLMDISARGSNRDGAALRFVAEQLSKRPEEIKLLFLVSDGQPADSGYYGSAAEEDLRGIKDEYEKKGILLVAAAIGDDKENIQRIYGDSFLDITDLNKLPVMLTDIIKRHIRV